MEPYDTFAKSHHLPDYDMMEELFTISSVDPMSLREIIKRQENRVQYLADTLEEILQPSPESLAHIQECRCFNAKDKEEIYKIYKQLQYLLRLMVKTLITNTKEDMRSTIKEVTKQLPELKQQSLPYLDKLMKSWTINDDTKDVLGYFG